MPPGTVGRGQERPSPSPRQNGTKLQGGVGPTAPQVLEQVVRAPEWVPRDLQQRLESQAGLGSWRPWVLGAAPPAGR